MPQGTGRKKIEIKRKEKERDRMVTFSKRRKGLFKKVEQLHSLSGDDIGILVFSPAGKPFVSGAPCFDHVLGRYYNKNNNNNDSNNVEVNMVMCQENCCEQSCGGASTSLDVDNACHYNNEDEEETGLWMSWLASLELEEYDQVDELLVIKKDLELIRERLIKRAAAAAAFNN